MTPTDALATALDNAGDDPPDADLSWYIEGSIPEAAARILAALPDGAHLFTVDSLATALHDRSMRCNGDRHYCADPDSPGSGHLRDARKLIQAAKEAERG